MSGEESPSLISRICCCYSSTSKEPAVELIRTNSLAGPKTEVAKETVEGFEEIDLNINGVQSSSNATDAAPKVVVHKEVEAIKHHPKKDEFILNDIMMNEICEEDEQLEEEPVIEDVISIRTNVIEEVDEEELEALNAQVVKVEPEASSEAVADSQEEEKDETSRSNEEEKVSINQLIKEGYESPGREDVKEEVEKEENAQASIIIPPPETVKDVILNSLKELTDGYIDDEDGDDGEGVVDVIETSRSYTNADVATLLSTKNIGKEDLEEDDSDNDDDEILIHEVSFPKNSSTPPPPQVPSIMYAELSGDEESDDEDEHDILPPPPERPKLVSMASEEGVEESEGEVEEIAPVPSPRRLNREKLDDVTHEEIIADDSELSEMEDDEVQEKKKEEKKDKKEDAEEDINNIVEEVSDGEFEDAGSRISEDELPEMMDNSPEREKENQGITRLSLKSDGRVTMTNGNVRVALDVREMTDDEFSEKLI